MSHDTPRSNIVRDDCKGLPWREAFKRMSSFADNLERCLTTAEAEIAELRKDKLRLDTIEQNRLRLEYYHGAWHFEGGTNIGGAKKTIRSAIDAAISSQQPEP